MSNKLYITATEFKDFEGVDYGFRIYDEYDKSYQNGYDVPFTDDIALLQEAVVGEPHFFDFIVANSLGLDINGTWYDYDQIKEYL